MQMTKFTLTLWLLLLLPSLCFATDLQVRKTQEVQPRAWGFEVRASVTDKDTNHLYPVVMTFKKKPTAEQIKTELARRTTNLKTKIDNPGPGSEQTYLESEVVELLIKKCYLKKGQSLDDLADLCKE